MMSDLEYWEMAAQDRDVDTKYIADVDTEECLAALAPALDGEQILELGSGVGRLTIPVANLKQKPTVIGVDLSPKMIAIATERAKKAGVRHRCLFIEPKKTQWIKDESIDSAYTMLTIQHLNKETVEHYFREIHRVLKPRGIFRFQFVQGKYYGTRDNNYTMLQMGKFARDYFYWDEVEHGLIHPQWTWVTAIRRSA